MLIHDVFELRNETKFEVPPRYHVSSVKKQKLGADHRLQISFQSAVQVRDSHKSI